MTATKVASPLLTPAEAADYLSVGSSTMKRWRLNGDGPRYAKVGKGVRYRLEDIEAWVSDQLVKE